MPNRFVVLTILLATLGEPALAGVFQFAVAIPTQSGEHTAFLYLPPDAPRVRGIVMAGMTLMEQHFVKDPAVRRVCDEQGLALVFLTCGLGAADIQKVLDDLAAASGYRELSVAPLFFVGHSAGGPQARQKAIAMADRCFGLMQFRGGTPGDGPAEHHLPAGIPALVMMGQFDEFGGMMRDADGTESWPRVVDVVAAYRRAGESQLASIVVEPGAGHFAWSDRNAAYFAMFFNKAAAARIPAQWDTAAPPTLLAIDPATGWHSDLDLAGEASAAPAPVAEYAGDRNRTAWHFDQELAEATVAFHAGLGKRDQFIRWNDRTWVDAGVRHFFLGLTWVGEGDRFKTHPVYRDTYPPNTDQGPRWAAAGEPAGHSDAPIRVVPVAGPIEAVGDHTLRFTFDALNPAGRAARITFLAVSDGDATFRHTEQVGMAPRGFRGLDGRAQTITFNKPSDMRRDAGPLTLDATSDADLPVRFYVAHGPAVIENDNHLRIAALPNRARLPIEVKVVAYQFGRGIDPKVATAAPVEHTLHIVE